MSIYETKQSLLNALKEKLLSEHRYLTSAAEAIGYPYKSLQANLFDQSRNPSLETLLSIAELAGVEVGINIKYKEVNND